MSPKPSRDPSEAALADLLRRCAAADPAALHELYDAQAARMYGLALRITRQPSLAADAVHDAFVQVWRQAARFDPARGGAAAWLTGLVRYRALDIGRRRRREQLGYQPSEQADPGADPLALLLASSEGTALHRCLQRLEAPQRHLVVLAFVEGLSHSELAARAQQPLGTVKSTIRRALASLKRCLQT